MCVTCHWFHNDFWQPYSILSSAPVDSWLWLLPWSQSISYLVLLCSWCPISFPAQLYFPKNFAFSWCAQSSTTSILLFFSASNVSDLIASRTHLCFFIVVQGIWRALFQHHISNKSIFILSAFFTLQLLHLNMTSGNMRV